MTTPHRIGQVAKARIEIADLLEQWNSTDAHERADHIVHTLLDLGWTPPADPTADVPPLTGPGAPDDGPGRREWQRVRAELANRPREAKP